MGRRARTLLGPLCVASCVLSAAPRSAEAHNVYFDFTLPPDFAGVAGDLLLYAFPGALIAPPYLPSIHEAYIYRAIGEICAASPSECGFLRSTWNDCTAGTCSTFEDCNDFARPVFGNCHRIGYAPVGEGGFGEWNFTSLLLGARFVDMRELSGFEAPNIVGIADYFEDALGGIRLWDARMSNAAQFPMQHTDGTTGFTENNRLFAHDWMTTPVAGGRRRDHPVVGVVERNQALLTAAAAFLVDRFFQAQPDLAPPNTLPIVDFSTIRATLGEHWRAGLHLAAMSAMIPTECPPAGLIMMGYAAVPSWGRTQVCPVLLASVPLASAACVASGLSGGELQWLFALDMVCNADHGEHHAVRPDLFYIGQGTHVIADSFAHTVRDFNNVWNPGGPREALPVAALRTDSTDTPWFYCHSDAADNNGEFSWMASVWGYDDGAGRGDPLFIGGDNSLGKANFTWGVTAIRDWLRVFYDPTSPSRDFDDRYGALREFVKTHFSYSMPQELSPGEVGSYLPLEKCREDDDCLGAFAEGDGVADGVCDIASGICRRTCTIDKDCRPGFSCTSGLSHDFRGVVARNRYCSVLWDPWESVGDEYFVQIQRKPDGDWTGKKWLPATTSLANEWYMMERTRTGVPEGWSYDRIAEKREWCRSNPPIAGQELVAILYEDLSYTGTWHCIWRDPGTDGTAPAGAAFPREAKSIYVEPRRHVCLARDDGLQLCLYGGLNGAAEGRLLRALRGQVASVSWHEKDVDQDGIPDGVDNCFLAGNHDQRDFDGDGFGNECDRDRDGDLVLEDGNGFWGLGDGTISPCRGPQTMTHGQRCDDNCPWVYNPARLDLGPLPDEEHPAGDGIRDQFDLDGDGLGDMCDGDPDGDRLGLRYADESSYDEAGEQDPPKPPRSAREPWTECADFLWLLSEDKDNDDVCDMYNFRAAPNEPAAWMPDPEYAGWPGPGHGYLKPSEESSQIDTSNSHYLSGSYRSEVGPCESTGACRIEVHVTPPAGSGAAGYPGEGGYTWAQVAAGVPGGVSYFGHEGCVRNLVDLWRYYQADDSATTLERQASGEGLEVGFAQPADDLVNRELAETSPVHQPPYWTPPYAPRHVLRDDEVAWNAMLPEIEFKRRQLERSLDPQLCQVDNCIRFMRLNGPFDTGADDIDPLSRRAMQWDRWPTREEGTARTWYCWTENRHEAAGDDETAPYSAQLFCDVCRFLDSRLDPVPGTCEPVDSPDDIAPGYDAWYTNEDQRDTNRDGIGDKCSAWVDITDLAQDHVTRRLWGGTWESAPEWREYAMSPAAVDWSRPQPIDPDSGLPLRNYDDWSTSPETAAELAGLCEFTCGLGTACEVRKFWVGPEQKMEFAVSGSSEDPIPTTMGACACVARDDVRCDDTDLRCWHPDDGLWRTDPDAYRLQVVERERMGGPVVGTRPRYAGFRRFGNRTPEMRELRNLTIAEPCQPQTWIHSGPPLDLSFAVGWDQNPVSLADGCQEMAMIFETGDERRLLWTYPSQMEPDLRETTMPGSWYRDNRDGDQFWMHGYTTAMRIGIRVDAGTDRQYWDRQWHTPVYPRPTATTDPPDGSLQDRDRPVPETEFGTGRRGRVGIVFYEPTCGEDAGPDTDIVDGPVRDWPSGDPANAASKEKAVVGVREVAARAAVNFDIAEVVMGSGEVVQTQQMYALAAPGFPLRDFGAARLLLDARTAADLFGYRGTDATVTVDLVVGGSDAAGQPLADIWISRSWEPSARFEKLGLGDGPATGAGDVGGSPASDSLAVARPRLYVDMQRKRVLVLGGRTIGGGLLAEVHAFDLVTKTWSSAFGANASDFATRTGTSSSAGARRVAIPPGAQEARLAVDLGGKRAFLVSAAGAPMSGTGSEGAGTGAAGTSPDGGVRVFEVDLSLAVPVIREIAALGPGPEPRQGAAATYSPARHQVLLFGGAIERPPASGPGGVEPGPAGSDATGAGALVGDVWGFDPRTAAWSLLRADAGSGIARRNAILFAGNRGDAYVLGGEDETGFLPVDRALRTDLLPGGEAGWSTTNVSEPGVLVVDGAPHQGVWRPGDPVLYTVVGRNLHVDMTTPVQVILEAEPGALELVARSSTSRQTWSGDTGDAVGRATVALAPAEQYHVVVRGRSSAAAAEGVSYTLRAVSVLPLGRARPIHARRLTRFDAVGDLIYVADWTSLDIYRWNRSRLTRISSVAMEAAVDVEVAGTIAYVADFDQGLVTVDVSRPDRPRVLDAEWLLGNADAVAVHDRRVFLGVGIFGVAAVDVSDPAAVEWVEQIVPDPGAVVTDVSVSGNHLLIGDAARNVWIYGVGEDARVTPAGRYAGVVEVEDTVVHGTTLFVSNGRAAVEVVDVTRPASPRSITILHGHDWVVSARYGYDMAVHRGPGHRILVREMRESRRAGCAGRGCGRGEHEEDDQDDDAEHEEDEDERPRGRHGREGG